MSAAMEHLKSFLLKHRAAEFVEHTAAAMRGRPAAEAHLRLVQATERIEMELRGMSPGSGQWACSGLRSPRPTDRARPRLFSASHTMRARAKRSDIAFHKQSWPLANP